MTGVVDSVMACESCQPWHVSAVMACECSRQSWHVSRAPLQIYGRVALTQGDFGVCAI